MDLAYACRMTSAVTLGGLESAQWIQLAPWGHSSRYSTKEKQKPADVKPRNRPMAKNNMEMAKA